MERSLPHGWQMWHNSDDRVVLTYRPDVFDGERVPAACLPTIYVTRGRRSRRPGRTRTDRDSWFVTFYLEPEVKQSEGRFESRNAAFDRANQLARRFDAGEIDYREPYQVPRPAYFELLDAIIHGSRESHGRDA